MKSRLTQFLLSIPLLGLVLFLFAAAFPPFDDIAEVDLAVHMGQHVLLAVAGVLIAFPLFKRGLIPSATKKWVPAVSLIVATSLIAFWHLPVPWDTAVLDPLVHAVEHLSFLAVGLLIGSWTVQLSDSAKIGALLAGFFGHMAYAVVLILPFSGEVYGLYSVADQAVAGWALLLTGPSLIVGVAYLVLRNPGWLGGFSGNEGGTARRQTFVQRIHVPPYVVPALSVLLAMVFVGYLGATAFALSTSPAIPTGNALVYINETPVSWQYSPQNVKVVVGVNNTVTWVSRSLSYDTVTALGGSFSSGTIGPGQTWSHTFTQPGHYDYRCDFHPWMTGSVTVLAG